MTNVTQGTCCVFIKEKALLLALLPLILLWLKACKQVSGSTFEL